MKELGRERFSLAAHAAHSLLSGGGNVGGWFPPLASDPRRHCPASPSKLKNRSLARGPACPRQWERTLSRPDNARWNSRR